LRRTLAKLGASLPDGLSVRLDTIADFLSVLPATECQYNEEYFHTLTQAIVCRRRLELRYWSASRNETTTRIFDPYELSLIDDGWYAIGRCHLRLDIRMFAVQRVLSVRETGATFDRPADFRVEEYLSRSFRAVRGDGDYLIVLRFHAEVARRVAEKIWHSSQENEWQADGSLIVRMRLSSLVEVKRWVMWWGTDCEALEPAELCDLVRAEAAKLLARAYGSDSGATMTTRGSGHSGRRRPERQNR
jgi:predicted DNA-binding transcriptional regulator YafY